MSPNFNLDACMQKDLFRIKRDIRELKNASNKDKKIAQIQDVILKSQTQVATRQLNLPKISYPPLPITEKGSAILEALATNQVLIIAGETGSGKTTQLPKLCLDFGLGIRGFIGHTQPRRLAARSVATRIAEELNSPLGDAVGYKIRFNDKLSDDSYIKLMTDGILLAELKSDKYLTKYDAIIIDEAHERSLNIDFILGYLKKILPNRPDLKVIITSATIDLDRFSKHFDNAPIISIEGRTYPVTTKYRPLINEDADLDILDGICHAIDELLQEPPGDILIFMNGEREIRDLSDNINKRNYHNIEVLPLYARLSYQEQAKIFKPGSKRKIVLATNVAETSLTVPGIRYVIDPGTARISRYSYRTKVQRLPIEPISQASANQRQGRCGRVAAGICIRLYSIEDFNNRPTFTDPEILRTNLASVILQMLSIGLGDIEAFPFIQPPDPRYIKDGVNLLDELSCIEKKQNKLLLTDTGAKLAKIPVDPRFAKMIFAANSFACLHEVMVIVSALSIQDLRERPIDKQAKADLSHKRFFDNESDFISILKLWDYLQTQQKELSVNKFRNMCKSEFLSFLRFREWQDLYFQLKVVIKELNWVQNQVAPDYKSLHSALLSGLLSHMGQKLSENEFLGARQRKFFIFKGSALGKKPPPWIMATELTETTKLYARTCAKIDPAWAEPLAKHLVKYNYTEPSFDSKSHMVMAFESQSLFGLPIVTKRKMHYGSVDVDAARQIFIREALVQRQWYSKESFYEHNNQIIDEILELEHTTRRHDILITEDAIFDLYAKDIPLDVCNGPLLLKWLRKQNNANTLKFTKDELIVAEKKVSGVDFPKELKFSSFSLELSYKFEIGAVDDGVSMHVPLPLLNQIERDKGDWLVPGLLLDKLTALIKALPKNLRRNFVPAPDYAKACFEAMTFGEGDLFESFTKHLLRMSGVKVTKEDFIQEQLPLHFIINYKIFDSNGIFLREGRDLQQLQTNLKTKVVENIAKISNKYEADNIKTWDFAPLKEQIEKKEANFTITMYPAVVATKNTVAIKLFDNEISAITAHRLGVIKLISQNIPEALRKFQYNLPNKSKLAMYYNQFGTVQALIDDIIDASIESIVDVADIRNKEQFDEALIKVRAELNPIVIVKSSIVCDILCMQQEIKKRCKSTTTLATVMAIADIKSQLDNLVYAGFVRRSGNKLADIKRYLQGINKRLDKVTLDPIKDRLYQQSINYVGDEIKKLQNKYTHLDEMPVFIDEAIWLLEEYRISCFAQMLGTKTPVSEKRILKHLSDNVI